MKVAVFTDNHLTDDQNWHTGLSVPNVPYFDPIERTSHILQRIAAENPEVVLHLGDFIHAGEERLYPKFDQLYSEFLNGIPLWPVVGNHDFAPGIRDSLKIVTGDSAMNERELLSYRLDKAGWRIISVDANCGHYTRREGATGDLELLQRRRGLTLEWLGGELCDAPADAKIIICTHFPITHLSRRISGYKPTEFGQDLMKLLQQHSGKIKLVLHGHIHCGAQYRDNGDSGIDFRSVVCASYPLAQQSKFGNAPTADAEETSQPRPDPLNRYGYEILELPNAGTWSAVEKIVGRSEFAA